MLPASQLEETVVPFPFSHIVPRLFLPTPPPPKYPNENKAQEKAIGGGGEPQQKQTTNQNQCNQRCQQKKVPVACCTQKSKGNN